ncbi:hypothetical protein WAI453_006559 [Rhynchosporium graminicola]
MARLIIALVLVSGYISSLAAGVPTENPSDSLTTKGLYRGAEHCMRLAEPLLRQNSAYNCKADTSQGTSALLSYITDTATETDGDFKEARRRIEDAKMSAKATCFQGGIGNTDSDLKRIQEKILSWHIRGLYEKPQYKYTCFG